jgi:hypothetical protein
MIVCLLHDVDRQSMTMWKGVLSIYAILYPKHWSNIFGRIQGYHSKCVIRKDIDKEERWWYSLTRDLMINYLYNVSPLSSLLILDWFLYAHHFHFGTFTTYNICMFFSLQQKISRQKHIKVSQSWQIRILSQSVFYCSWKLA